MPARSTKATKLSTILSQRVATRREFLRRLKKALDATAQGLDPATWRQQDAAAPRPRTIGGGSGASASVPGIEGRISVLVRGRGMKRCRAEGAERFALFVAAAVLANNLMIVGELLTKRSRGRRKTNRQILSRAATRWNKPYAMSAQLHLAEVGPCRKSREKRSQIHRRESTVIPMKSV
jgi:hypothetical protein